MTKGLNAFGFSLTEILITLGIMSILGTVATVSYHGHNLDTAKKNLKTSGILFAGAVRTCISASGGWEIDRPDGTNLKPCKADNTTELKDKLSYNCPADATCETFVNTYTSGKPPVKQGHHKMYCLSIKKEVSGKHLQVFVRFNWSKPSDYELWCGETASYVAFETKSCRGEASGQPSNRGNIMGDLKQPCDWK